MSKSIEQLVIAIEKECEIYEQYFKLAEEKKEIIIKGEVKKLDYITQKEEKLMNTMQKIDQIRNTIVGNILYEIKVESVENISELCKYLDKDTKDKILNRKKRLEDLLLKIKNINELNEKLIKQSLEYIDFNVNILLSSESAGSTYGQEANENDLNKKSNIFDAKV